MAPATAAALAKSLSAPESCYFSMQLSPLPSCVGVRTPERSLGHGGEQELHSAPVAFAFQLLASWPNLNKWASLPRPLSTIWARCSPGLSFIRFRSRIEPFIRCTLTKRLPGVVVPL